MLTVPTLPCHIRRVPRCAFRAGGNQAGGCAAGDLLFTLVQGLQPAKDCAKITGMLLEMTEAEILHILEDRDALTKKARAHLPYQIQSVSNGVEDLLTPLP